MSEPYLSEIRMFSFGFAPKGWAQCNGQLLPINQNQALFSLMGTTYGGNGQTNFALPDLRGRAALHFGTLSGGSSFAEGQTGGEESHTLNVAEIPPHNHNMAASSNNADQAAPNGNLLANAVNQPLYHTSENGTLMAPNMITNAGGGQPHNNLQPHLVLNFCVAMQGVFPSRS